MKDFERFVLKIYPDIDRLVKEVDAAINSRIIASFYNMSSNYTQTEKIMRLMDKKGDLLRLKGLIKSAYSGVNGEKKYYLKRSAKCGSYIDYHGIELPRRTYYRKIKSAYNAFSSELKRLKVEEWYDCHMREIFDWHRRS